MDVLILAGGFGTRLQSELDEGLPKPLAPVEGKPFLAHLMHYVQQYNPSRFLLSIHYGAEKIRAAIGNQFEGVPVTYIQEDSPLGTGGAIMYAIQEAVCKKPLIVLNGDTFCQVDLAELYNFASHQKNKMTIVLRKVKNVERYGACLFNKETKNLTGFEEKGKKGPGWINAGVYVIDPELLTSIVEKSKFSFEEDVLFTHASLFKVFPYGDYFIDIGIPQDYKLYKEHVRKNSKVGSTC